MANLEKWIAAQRELVSVSADVDPTSDRSAAECGEGDRTIYARRAIADGTVLVKLDRGAYLNGSQWLSSLEDKVEPSDLQRLRDELSQRSPSATVMTALALLHEVSRGDKSHFHGYIQQLPQRIPLPMTWSESERAMLRSTAASPIVDFDLVRNVFKSFVSPLQRMFQTIWSAEECTLERFVWAYTVISSRAFSIDDLRDPTLLPVIDMANHDAEDPNAEIRRSEDGSFSLVATRAIAADEPVTISYGNLSNAQVSACVGYGFVLPHSTPNDTILLQESDIRDVFSLLLGGASHDDALALLTRQTADTVTTTEAEQSEPADDSEAPSAAKRRRLFVADTGARQPKASDMLFALNSNAAEDFGISDTLLSFVMANELSTDVLHDVLTVLLQFKDKSYSQLLASAAASPADDQASALSRQLVTHERQITRRILLGIMTMEEESSSDGEQDPDDEEDEDEEAEEDEEA
ncbi:hypothetical protein P43SY_000215 [Pythium insidiosum]|uniref:SET domain-containing protein n=1 Tax=Pythium insidiosum TaxID=114742 RepID=A0AAD5LRL4_PYTIN|nr:hypothetical protein P43SY_000215 [Pythium insidiosum]